MTREATSFAQNVVETLGFSCLDIGLEGLQTSSNLRLCHEGLQFLTASFASRATVMVLREAKEETRCQIPPAVKAIKEISNSRLDVGSDIGWYQAITDKECTSPTCSARCQSRYGRTPEGWIVG